MPTLIDSLVVSLGLDSRDLSAKTPAATKQLKDIDQAAAGVEKTVKKVGATSKETASGFTELARSAGTFLAVIGGATALKVFILDFIEANAALKRLSDNLGLAVQDISAWSNATEELGGSATGLQGTLDMLSKAQTQLKLTGESSLIPYFSALGISIANVAGHAKPVTDILLELADRFSQMDRPTANNMGRMMGIDQGTMNLLLQGRKELELTLRRQRESNAVTKAQAEEAQKLQTQIVRLKQGFAAFGRGLLEQALPMLEKVLGWLTELGDWIRANSEVVGDFLKVMAVGLGAIAIAALPIDLVVVGILALAAAIALLWQDYQTWKRGGDSLIDWAKWKPEIDAAITGMEKLAAVAQKTFGFVAGAVSITKDLANGNRAAAGATFGRMIGKDVDDPETIRRLQAYNYDTQKTDAKSMQSYFQQRGYSPAQAAGLAANLMTESGGKTNAVGDHGAAYGLGQWHKDRQDAFKEFAGHDIRLSTTDEQLAFVVHELAKKGTEQAAGDRLRATTTPQEAGAIISRYYERPLDVEGNAKTRGDYAAQLAKTAPPTPAALQESSVSPWLRTSDLDYTKSLSDTDSTPAPGAVTNAVHVDTIEVHTQATDAPGIVSSMGEAMNYLFTSQANPGLR